MRLTWRDNFYFALWDNIHNLPYFLIKKWHKIQIARIVKEAYSHVPMYRTFWSKHGIFPNELKKFDDFRQFPVIIKSIIRSFSKEEQLNSSFLDNQLEWRQTSGSTGEPFRFPANPLYAKYFPDKRFLASARRRFLIWRGITPNQIFSLRFCFIGCRSYQVLSPNYLFIPISEFNSNPETALQKIAIFKPELIESMTTVVEELARCALKKSTVPLTVAYVVTTGERMAKAQRNIIEKAFGCEAFNLYGMEEIGTVGTECRLHCGFHIAEESYLVEILDSDGNLLPTDTFGRVVITSFYNDSMPFIKYDTGDEGMIFKKSCACGLSSRLLIIQSRRGGHLTVGGVRYNAIELSYSLGEFSDTIFRYQIVKTAEGKIELHVIPTVDFHESDVATISEKWRQKFKIIPKIILVDSLTTDRSGKTPVIIEKSQTDNDI